MRAPKGIPIMSAMHRRTLLSAAALAMPLPLLNCGLTGNAGAVTLAQAQMYGTDLANALSAGAVIYLAGPPKPSAEDATIVNKAIADIQTAKTALANATATTSAIGVANELLNAALQLSPLVMGSLGAAGPYIPLAIAILQAFIASLPPPAVTPATPPAALHAKAMTYRAH